jgi:hypothetical protein
MLGCAIMECLFHGFVSGSACSNFPPFAGTQEEEEDLRVNLINHLIVCLEFLV